jgi:hypothetical protein
VAREWRFRVISADPDRGCGGIRRSPRLLGQAERVNGEFRPRCEPPRRLVRPVPLDPTGNVGPTRGQGRRGRWRRTTNGCYVPSTVTDDLVEQRILEQSVRLPRGGAVTGWAAARLHGGAFFDGVDRDGRTRLPVPLVVPPDRGLRALPGSTVCREPLAAEEVTTVAGLPVTTPVRAVFDEMRRVDDLREAVVALDMAAAAELVSLREISGYLARRRSWRRSRRVTSALGLASELSVSPGESRMRLVWVVDAGLPPPLVNQPVWDLGGRLLGVADVFDPDAGLVGEYDGATHRNAQRHAKDVRREDQFRRAGLEYAAVTGPDLDDRAMLADRLRQAHARALEQTRPRGWTLTPPAGWWRTDTAADRLARRDWLRSQGVPA